MSNSSWPAWFYGPAGEAKIFEDAASVPAGWQDHPSKTNSTGKPAKAAAPTVSAATNAVEIDAHGHPWSADLHAASKGKTSAGLWRMKVGARRPAPLEGYPITNEAAPAPLDL